MFDDAEMKKSKELTRIYCDRYNLMNGKFSDLHRASNKFERDAIRRKPEACRSGCYFIYSDTGKLLYLGSTSAAESGILVD
jgi:hypothetical protein